MSQSFLLYLLSLFKARLKEGEKCLQKKVKKEACKSARKQQAALGMGKARSRLHFPSAAASRRALTWEGAAEAVPARMSRCCLLKVFPSPYKVILKGKYFPSNLGDWSRSIFRHARACEAEQCLAFALICCLVESVPSLCFTWGHGTVMQCSGGLAGNQAGAHASFSMWYTAFYVCGWDFPCTYPTVLHIELIFTFSDIPAVTYPLNFSKKVVALLAGV